MKRKIICYFETEAQCEAAVTALCSAKIEQDAVRIISDNTKSKAESPKSIVGAAAGFALPAEHAPGSNESAVRYTQAPIATLLIRGDLFTFRPEQSTPLGCFAVEVCGDKATLELARDILLNLF